MDKGVGATRFLTLGLVGLLAAGCQDDRVSSVSAEKLISEERRAPTANAGRTDRPKPLPDLLANQICSLTRETPEQDLVARFGKATKRTEEHNVVTLMWKNDNWMGVAKYTDNELQLAGINVVQTDLDASIVALSSIDGDYKVGEATRAELEAHLGDGVRTSVSWHHGIDIDADTARANNIPLRALEDHCNDRVTFMRSDTGQLTTLAFRDGVLDGHFDE